MTDQTSKGAAPEFSVVIPMKNESGNVALLLAGLERACAGHRFEVLMVDDGSSDDTAQVVRAARASRPWLRLIRHAISGGQSAAVHSGVLAARAAVVCTMDGDGQNPPAEIPRIAAPLIAAGASPRLALVAGQRLHRKDSLSKRLASRFANWLRSALLHDDTRDTGCGLKAFRRAAFLDLPYFNNMHRYLPALFKAHGWQVMHVDVSHEARHAGRSNYTNLHRALVGIHDLIGVGWLIQRRKIPRPEEDTSS